MRNEIICEIMSIPKKNSVRFFNGTIPFFKLEIISNILKMDKIIFLLFRYSFLIILVVYKRQ